MFHRRLGREIQIPINANRYQKSAPRAPATAPTALTQRSLSAHAAPQESSHGALPERLNQTPCGVRPERSQEPPGPSWRDHGREVPE